MIPRPTTLSFAGGYPCCCSQPFDDWTTDEDCDWCENDLYPPEVELEILDVANDSCTSCADYNGVFVLPIEDPFSCHYTLELTEGPDVCVPDHTLFYYRVTLQVTGFGFDRNIISSMVEEKVGSDNHIQWYKNDIGPGSDPVVCDGFTETTDERIVNSSSPTDGCDWSSSYAIVTFPDA